ncbi:hypothetical protein [Prevotella sp.]|uniref:hypothetical protein n=1 Tax=Prevotella sp. TaxID=59823 RepID=UPI002F93BB4A
MKKQLRTYTKPKVNIISINMESHLLAGSGDTNHAIPIKEDGLPDNISAQSKPYTIWEDDLEWD